MQGFLDACRIVPQELYKIDVGVSASHLARISALISADWEHIRVQNWRTHASRNGFAQVERINPLRRHLAS